MGSSFSQQQLPNEEVVALARTSAEELSRLLADKADSDRAHVQMDGRNLILPRDALALLRDLLATMAQGHAVTLMPLHAELTTQEAANLLNVSRPYLIKLLETGEIAFTKTGVHRRIRYQDLMAYKQVRAKQSENKLEDLSRQAQDHDMGY